jgi:dTDP-4-dehydrorhamnose 3,5-epimerase
MNTEPQFNPLRTIENKLGDILHMMRADSPHFAGFGEVYFSWINPGAIKGWTRHQQMTVNLAVPVGRVRIVVCEENGAIKEYVTGAQEYGLLTIPPGYWYAFQCLSDDAAMIANCASHVHDPDEMQKRDLSNPPASYVWPEA